MDEKVVETPKDLLIKKDKLYIRFFMWVWGMEEDELDQCRVFWGLLGFPFGLLHNEKHNFNGLTKSGFLLMGVSFLFAFISLLVFTFTFDASGFIYACAWFIMALACLVIGYFSDMAKIEKSDKAKKVLNKITIIGEAIGEKLQAFFGLIFYIPCKIFMFFWRPIWKILLKIFPPIGKAVEKFFDDDRVQGFFSFIVKSVLSYKKKHCRKIKLVE